MSSTEPIARPAENATPAGIPVLNYMQLRQIAEWASGYRGKPFWMVARHDENARVRIEKRDEYPAELEGAALIIPCETRDTTQRPRVVEASIRADGAAPVNLLDLHDARNGIRLGAADSVFWSQSAVEKFLVPYYASVGGETAGEWVTTLLNLFEGLPTTASAAGEGEPGKETSVYGLVHMPKSEYIEVTGGESGAGEELGVILYDRETSESRIVRLRDFIAQRRGGL